MKADPSRALMGRTRRDQIIEATAKAVFTGGSVLVLGSMVILFIIESLYWLRFGHYPGWTLAALFKVPLTGWWIGLNAGIDWFMHLEAFQLCIPLWLLLAAFFIVAMLFL